jgi:GTPase SAR1 family protein
MLTTFKITDQKAIKLAECNNVPRIMIIFGQNNVGKSTLLYAVKENIMKNVVKNEDIIFISLSDESPQEENAGSDIQKYDPFCRINSVLSQLEVVRRNILANSSLLDNKDISPVADYTSISQVYEPLNKLLAILLPHLKFEKVNMSNTDSPKCIFSKVICHGDSHSSNQVDINKLTRLEIEVISQFLPLVEYQILRKLAPRSDASSFSDAVVLMDTPGAFLPSQLQSLLLEYIRFVVREENEHIQFIIVTSRSDLFDNAISEERFMLMPSEHLAEDSNQLVKVSDANLCLMH